MFLNRILLPLAFIYLIDKGTLCFTDLYLESIKFLNETSKIPAYGTVGLKRMNHSHPMVFMEAELVESFRKYDGEVRIFYSPLGNRRYYLLPFKLPRQPMCNILNNYYRKYIMHDAIKYCNCPFSEDKNVDLCDLMPVGHYYTRNYSVDPSFIPRLLSPGRYRVQVLFYKTKESRSWSGMEITSMLT